MSRFVFDIDGTLCFDGFSIDPEITSALEEAAGRHTVVFASARSLRDLIPVLPPTLQNQDLIGANGALRRQAGVVTGTYLDDEVRRELDALIVRHGVGALREGDWDYSYTGDGTDEIIDCVFTQGHGRAVEAAEIERYTKVILFSGSPELRADVEALGVELTGHGVAPLIDISAAGVTKGSGLNALFGPGEEFIAFGNDTNDVSMFDLAASSYCVGVHPAGEYASERIDRSEVAATIRALSAQH